MGCGAAAFCYKAEVDDDDLEGEKGRRTVTPPAEILTRDFSSMLTLSFRGEGLKDGERSFLVVYTKASGENLWTELGKTEVCSLDTTWPVWGTIMELEFRVEVIRHMRCEAYKMSSSNSLEELWHHKFIGACEFLLTEAVTSRAKVHNSSDGWLRKKLMNIHRKRGEKHPGRVCVFADEKHSSKLELYFKLTATQLQTGEFWKRKPDPFFVVSRAQVIGTDAYDLEEVGLAPCYRSEVARRTQDPRFGNAVVTAAQVSHGVAEQDFIITVKDWNRLGESKVLGEVVMNFNELWKAAGERNLKMPLCKREGPRLKGMLRYTYAQIKRHRQTLTVRDARKTFSGTLARLGSRMGSTTFGPVGRSFSRTFSRSFSTVKERPGGSPESKDRSSSHGSPFASEEPRSSQFPPGSKDSARRTRKSHVLKDQRSSSHASALGSKDQRSSQYPSESKDTLARRTQVASKEHVFSSEFSAASEAESREETLRRGTQRSYTSQVSMSSIRSSQKKRSGKTIARMTTSGLGGLTPTDKTLFFGPVIGQVSVQEMILDRTYTFLDYVRGGLELRTMLGIDFTRSNMDVMNPDSLHSQCEKGLATAYEDAICNLGQVLRSYDTSNEYFVYGFGAKIPPSHTVCSNCFALTGDFLYPKVKGLDGILQAYRRALNVVQLHGPSCCAEVLNLAGRFSKKFVQEPEKEMLRSSVPPEMLYFVLLILTDGELESEKKVVEELRQLQAYPISVCFIGIGSKDFSFMRELPDAMALYFEKDFDKPKLENVSKQVCRRVVQFVQYSEYESNPDGLVAATLADLPREIVLYYRMLGVKPRGLDRFENRFGESVPTPLPKAAKLEWKAAEQRTADRKARENIMASRTTRRDHDASKDTAGSGSGSGPKSLGRTPSRQSQVNSLEGDTPPMDGAEKEPKEENGEKKAVLFPAGSQMNTVKMLTFYRKEPFDLSAEFTEDAPLLPMTPRSLGKFRVELPQQTEKKKVKVKARLTLHGTFTIDSAQMVEEEEVEEIVREKRELPPEPEEVKETKAKTNGTVPSPEGAGQPPDADAPDAPDAPDGAAPEAVPAEATADADTAPPAPAENGAKTMETETSENVENGEDETKEADGNGDAKEEKEKDEAMEEETLEPAPPPKRMEPRFEWVEVVKKRKLTKTSDLRISATGRPGLSPEILQQRQDEETQMQAEMREIIETDERKNDLEGYIFNARAKIGDGGDWVPFIAPDDRQKFEQELQKAEDWLFDHFDGTKIQFIDKLDELKALGDPVQSRCKESGSREEVLRGVRSNVSSYRQVAAAPGERYGHIASEKLEKILAACQDFESWLNELQQKQEAMPKYQKPILTCTEMEKRSQELAKTADEILREPKPKEEPKEIHLDEKDEKEVELLDEEKAVDEKEEPAKGDEPRDMEVD